MTAQRAMLVIVGAALFTFGLTFTLLQVPRSVAAPGEAAIAPLPVSTLAVGSAVDWSTVNLPAGQSAIGVPIAGSEALLRDVEAGDRLDVLASVQAADSRPVTAVVVRNATVLRRPVSGEPLLLSVSSPDAIVVAHLVLGGTHLAYAVWPANGDSPIEPQPMDEQTARGLLGLAAPTPTLQPQSTPLPVPPLTLTPPVQNTPVGRTSGFIYLVQAGDTWDSAATLFGLSAVELRQWNDAAADAPLDSGTLLIVPRR